MKKALFTNIGSLIKQPIHSFITVIRSIMSFLPLFLIFTILKIVGGKTNIKFLKISGNSEGKFKLSEDDLKGSIDEIKEKIFNKLRIQT
eukprot:jgi/Orpsp1_1/1181398/evm.model.c7180000077074.2